MTLVNDMLSVVAQPLKGHDRRGNFQLQSVACDFITILNDVIRTATPKHGVKIQPLDIEQSAQQVCGNQSHRLLGDPDRFREIVSHLVSNAIKFTPSGEVRVTISARPTSPEGATTRMLVVVAVRDTGIGISQDNLTQIFEPFAQGDNTARRYAGTGVGLTISRNLAEIMKGNITVSSTPGKGSEFVFSCPVCVSQTPSNPLLSSPVSRSSNHHTRLSISSTISSVSSRAPVSCSPILEVSSKLGGGALFTDKLQGHSARGSFDASGVGPLDASSPPWSRMSSPQEVFETPPTVSTRIVPRPSQVITPLDGPVPPSRNSPTSSEYDSNSPRPKREGAFAGHMCIVVDDIPVNLKILCTQLRRLGFSIETAVNGKEAVEVAMQHGARAFCIFMDIMMPEMDGLQATKEIRRLGTQPGLEFLATLPIFACTTSESEDFLRVGMNGCLLKPVSGGDIQELFRMASLR